MNRPEAYGIISTVLERYRDMGFADLSARVGSMSSEDVFGASGVRYTVDVVIEWSDRQQRALIIRGRIDDQDTFHFAPLEERIQIKDPDHARSDLGPDSKESRS